MPQLHELGSCICCGKELWQKVWDYGRMEEADVESNIAYENEDLCEDCYDALEAYVDINYPLQNWSVERDGNSIIGGKLIINEELDLGEAIQFIEE